MIINEIKKKIKDEEIKAIQLHFININGQLQSIEIPTSQFEAISGETIMIDGSSIVGYTTITTSDLFLKPDWTTFRKISFLDTGTYGNIARVICFVLNKDGSPFSGDPRSILNKIEEKYKKDNYQLYSAFEAEFFLLKKVDGKYIPADNAGYFAVAPLDTGDVVKREIAKTLENHGFEVEAYHKEVAKGQHEINFKYDTLLKTADKLITYKWIVRTIANKHGFTATFMPKPFQGINGSGMHSNLSIFKNGKNIFARKREEKINDIQGMFITGLLNRSKEIAAITNPTVNSYKRLIPGYEAPNCIAWSDSNRTAMIRVPASFGSSSRVEQRNVDPTANPYLVLALLFEAGIEGIKNKVKIAKPRYENLFKQTRQELKNLGVSLLPDSLGAALAITSKSEFVKKVLGEHSFSQFIKYKYNEWDEFRKIVHTWEWEKYLEY